jgi:hypothetical protein
LTSSVLKSTFGSSSFGPSSTVSLLSTGASTGSSIGASSSAGASSSSLRGFSPHSSNGFSHSPSLQASPSVNCFSILSGRTALPSVGSSSVYSK